MAKIYGITGLVTGKLAGAVYAVRNGVQIARAYNPNPAQPKTEAQVESQAKLKLLSQLSAAIAPVIAISRKGAVSARNQFTQRNYEYVGYGNDQATIEMADILLTASNAGFPNFNAERASGNAINVALDENAANAWDRVVYVVLKKTDSQSIMPATSLVVSEAGVDGTFPASLDYVSGDISVHAYGIRLNSANSRVAFGNLIAPTAEEVVKIITSRTYSESDYTLSETRGLYMGSLENSGTTAGTSRVTITTSTYNQTSGTAGGGSVTGGGRVDLGEVVTLTASPNEGFSFVGWQVGSSSAIVSSNATYTFTASGNERVTAVFAAVSTQAVVIVARATGSAEFQVTGAGSYAAGTQVTLTANVGPNDEWDGFYEDAARTQKLTGDTSYTFEMGDVTKTIYYYGSYGVND